MAEATKPDPRFRDITKIGEQAPPDEGWCTEASCRTTYSDIFDAVDLDGVVEIDVEPKARVPKSPPEAATRDPLVLCLTNKLFLRAVN